MDNLLKVISAALPYFFLMFLRVSGILILSPIFGRKNVPNTMKIGFCIILTYLFAAIFPPNSPYVIDNVAVYVYSCVKELAIGFILGYVTTLFFSIATSAGYMIDVQMGISMSGIFDQQTSSNVAVTGNLLNMIMLLYFFISDGHHMLLKILYSTFQKIPVGHVSIPANIVTAVVELFINAFSMSFCLMMPVIAVSLLVDFALGLATRTVPQLNAFIVGIPLKIILGFVILLFMQPLYVQFCSTLFNKMFESTELLLGKLAVIT
ncbi:MAG: flagellar biosynthetic protein FliR [Bacillota bacterium]|nr:flagellar biosynthetic protein FliR [Bacillota bacterium]